MDNERFIKRLVRSSWISIVILVLIYVLGMVVNLSVEIPEGAEAWSFATRSGMLLSHIVLGTLLAFHTGAMLFTSIKSKSKMWTTVAVIGFLGILLSIASGSSFISQQTELSSFLMAVGLAISFLAYSTGMYLTYSSKR